MENTRGNSKAVWEDVTGATPLTFVKDCVSFTTTISARFWLVDCSNVSQAPNMASELYNVASHVPFMAKFVVFAKRTDLLEARLRVFCMTDDKEDKTLEHQEHFTEVAKSRDVEVMQGRPIHVEFVGNLIPIAKSGDPLKLEFHAFKENRLPFTVRVRDPDETTMARILFMREPKVARGEPAQSPLCTLNIGLPDNIVPESAMSESDLLNLDISHQLLAGRSFAHTETIQRADIRLSDISNLLAGDWRLLAAELGIADDDVRAIGQEYGDNPRQQALVMLKLWMKTQGPNATGNNLEKGLRSIHREDIVNQCIYNLEIVTDDMERAVAKTRLDQSGFDTLQDELGPSRDSTLNRSPSTKGKKSHSQEDHSDIENEKFLDDTAPSPIPPSHEDKTPSPIPHYEHPSPEPNHQDGVARLGDIHPNHITEHTETFQHETQPTDNHTQHVHETTTITSHSNEDPSVVETTTITTTTTKKSKQKPKPKKRTEPKSLVSDFLSQEITNSSHQLVEIPSGENPAKNPSPSPRTHPEDGTGWEKYHKDEGNGNKPWEFDEGEEGFNGNGNKNGDSKLSREQQELWRSPSLEAEMIINEDVTHETRWSQKRRDSGDDSGSDYEKEMKRSSSGNNNHSQNNGGAKSKIPPSSSGSDVAVREGASDSEEDNTNNGADLTHENSAQNINELVSNKKLHS
ncbi:hypothetical protein M8J76_002558 [Diaphorina citri]|nr:hypothetical protein M8J75_015307 [Diaphorina citri]KAI5732633.1 hypothetical protein M8J76_002558 [Diaphorina citri]